MIAFRPARATDVPELVSIIEERFTETRFLGAGHVDKDVARKFLAPATFRHGQTNGGATWFEVAVDDETGRIEAFILATLVRAYCVGSKLWAQDIMLLGRPDADPRALNGLLDHYIAWGNDNPRVVEITLSWSDILPEAPRMDAIYTRKGFKRCGAFYRRETRQMALEAA